MHFTLFSLAKEDIMSCTTLNKLRMLCIRVVFEETNPFNIRSLYMFSMDPALDSEDEYVTTVLWKELNPPYNNVYKVTTDEHVQHRAVRSMK